MPIYEYKCRDCGKTSEHRILSQADVKTLSCDGCGSANLEKLMSVPNISTGRHEPSGQTCCGRPQSCSDKGHCCGH